MPAVPVVTIPIDGVVPVHYVIAVVIAIVLIIIAHARN